MARLFVAVWPPEDVVEMLRALPRKDERGVRFLPPENWHVTLRFLGAADVDDVAGALERVALPAATAHLGAGVDVLFDRVIAVPVGGLDELATVVGRATDGLGTEPPRARFLGHLTLARVRRHAHMPKALGAFVQADWPVTEVALVQSRLRPSGAEYETVATWPTL